MFDIDMGTDRKWRRGVCIDKVAPRSYLVNVNGSLYQRNQKFLRVAKERLSKPVQENLPGAQSYKHQPERPSPTSLPPIDTPVIPLEDHPQ